MIHPCFDGVRFLESFGPKEDSDAPHDLVTTPPNLADRQVELFTVVATDFKVAGRDASSSQSDRLSRKSHAPVVRQSDTQTAGLQPEFNRI